MKEIIESSLKNSMSYDEYKALVKKLIAEDKVTGNNQSEDLLNFSILNDKRMQRLDKKIVISEDTVASVKKVAQKQTWLVITEGWCGDAAQNLPVIHKIANENTNIELRLVLRDDHAELMDQFLTDGNKAIPKLILLDENRNVINTWGPRPSTATSMVKNFKEKNGKLTAEFKKDLQIWYNTNKGRSTQEDFISLLN